LKLKDQRRTPRCLQVAICIWKRGEPLSLDRAMELMALGYDVQALEARYRA